VRCEPACKAACVTTIKRHFDLSVALLVGFWVVAVIRDFREFDVTIAVLLTVRVVIFERKAYRLVTRGWKWEPSRNPDDYR
jgi:hypothetical protein